MVASVQASLMVRREGPDGEVVAWEENLAALEAKLGTVEGLVGVEVEGEGAAGAGAEMAMLEEVAVEGLALGWGAGEEETVEEIRAWVVEAAMVAKASQVAGSGAALLVEAAARAAEVMARAHRSECRSHCSQSQVGRWM